MRVRPEYVVLVLFVVLPLVLPTGPLTVYIFIALSTIVVSGLSLLMGFAGQVSLGQAAFYAIGAYTAALLARNLGVPPLIGLLIAPAATALIAAVVGLPLLRLRGHYLAFGTLAFQLITLSIIAQARDITGGDTGLPGIPPLSIGPLTVEGPFKPIVFAYLAWAPGPADARLQPAPRDLATRTRPAGAGHQRGRCAGFGRASRPLQAAGVCAVGCLRRPVRRGVRVLCQLYRARLIRAVVVDPVPDHGHRRRAGHRVGQRGRRHDRVPGRAGLQSVGTAPGMPLRAPAVFSYAVYGLVLAGTMLLLPQGVVPAVQRAFRSRRAASAVEG